LAGRRACSTETAGSTSNERAAKLLIFVEDGDPNTVT
jgi:hypothetical protein